MKQGLDEIIGQTVIALAVCAGFIILFTWANSGYWGSRSGEPSTIPKIFRFVIAIGVLLLVLESLPWF